MIVVVVIVDDDGQTDELLMDFLYLRCGRQPRPWNTPAPPSDTKRHHVVSCLVECQICLDTVRMYWLFLANAGSFRGIGVAQRVL